MGFIQEKNIFLEQTFQTQEEVFRFLSAEAVALGIASNQEEVYEKLIERENEGTTGMMDGFAIPHAKAATIHAPAIIIVKLVAGIEWQSLDGSQTDFVIALFIPDSEAGTTHLKLLSTVARLLMRQEITSGLKVANSAKEIMQLLNNQLDEGEL